MIKLPKFYQASGYRLKISRGNTLSLDAKGRLNLTEEWMIIDKTLSDYETVETFIHECFECSLMANLACFDSRQGSYDLLYSFKHDGLKAVCQEVGRGVLDLIELNKK